MKKILFIAHRGGGAGIHENRIETIRGALKEKNIDGVEIDLRKTKDGVLVIHHDRGVYINGRRVWVDKIRYSEVKHLGIPTFKEILPLFEKSDKILNIDVKDENCVRQLREFFRKKNYGKRIFFDCHNLNVLLELQNEIPNAEFNLTFTTKDSFDFMRRFIVKILVLLATIFFSQLIIYFLKKRIKKVKLDGVNIYYRVAKKQFIKDLKLFGFKVYIWGTDKEADIRKILNTEIDGIKTRNVKLINKISSRYS